MCLLLDRGVKVDARDSRGLTAYCYSARGCHTAAMHLLLGREARAGLQRPQAQQGQPRCLLQRKEEGRVWEEQQQKWQLQRRQQQQQQGQLLGVRAGQQLAARPVDPAGLSSKTAINAADTRACMMCGKTSADGVKLKLCSGCKSVR